MEGQAPSAQPTPKVVTTGQPGDAVPTPQVGKPGDANGSATTPQVERGVNGYGSVGTSSLPSQSQLPVIRQTHDAPTQGSYRPFTSAAPHHNYSPTSSTPLPGASTYRLPTLDSELSSEKRFSTVEKGKGRIPSPPPAGQSYISRPMPSENQSREASIKNANGHHGEPPKANPPTAHVTINPAAVGTLSQIDKAFAERVEANNRKPALGRNIKGLCPVWSNTRRGLQSALEYMRNPIKTAGASIDISPGGMARGIILEGQTPSDLAYWGEKEEGGTLILPIGKPRAHRRAGNSDIAMDVDDPPPVTASDDAMVKPLSRSDHLPEPNNAQKPTNSNRPLESSEIEALLLTHRARTPIAVAVAQDYAHTPFCVPRPFVVLGWYWIIDAWVEPVAKKVDTNDRIFDVDNDRVVWKFRFEYQFNRSEPPWWQRIDEVNPRSAPVITTSDTNQEWQLTPHGPTTSYQSADQFKREQALSTNGETKVAQRHWCKTCDGVSSRPYLGRFLCLNETCKEWEVSIECIKQDSKSFVSGTQAGISRPRITAESLRMELRPPEPVDWDARMTPSADYGRQYWTGWVCGVCGCASERKKWYGWTCESCGRRLYPKHWEYSAENLRGPLRPVSTGPRPDDGLASWPFEVSHAWTLFEDDVKVVRHGVEAGFGKGTVIYHSLNHEGPILARRRINVNDLFKELQRTRPLINRRELAYRRHHANPRTPRMCERHLSPFYTLLLGPDPAPAIDSLPTAERSVPWHEADSTFLDLADLINERAGQIFPGEPEFNSLLVAVTPPGLSAVQSPRVYVPAHSYMSFTFLGSDGLLKFRRPPGTGGPRGKQGQITLQHGDVVGVQTGPDELEVIVQQEGFGIFCIGRQIYRLENVSNDQVVSQHQDPFSRKGKAHVTNKPPPRPTKDFHVPLTYWYIGPFPLDPERPMKVQPSLQIHPADLSMPTRPTRLDDDGYKGIEVVHNAETPRLHDPPHIPGEKNGRKRKIADQSESAEGSEKVKAKAKPRKSAAKVVGEEKSVDGASPAKKKGRKSGAAVPNA